MNEGLCGDIRLVCRNRGTCVEKECTQDCILGDSRPSLRDLIGWVKRTQHCVLGYYRPELSKLANCSVL
jgi:hypothetical protein